MSTITRYVLCVSRKVLTKSSLEIALHANKSKIYPEEISSKFAY